MASTRPRCGFCFAVSGNKMPPVVFSSASSGSTTSRSSNGRIRISLVLAIVQLSVCGPLSVVRGPLSVANSTDHGLRTNDDLHHVHATHAAHAAAHSAHATHAAVMVVVVATFLLLLGDVGDQRFSCQQETRGACAVLQGASRDFDWVNDA